MPDDAKGGNPFLIPRMTVDQPCLPLCPWKAPDHDNYYVPVDRTEEAYAHFKDHMATPQSIVDYGRLVIADGRQGCGKTSLINRCIACARDRLLEEKVNPVIIDLTRAVRTNQSTAERLKNVCAALIDELELESRLDRNTLDQLSDRAAEPRSAYSFLSRVLDKFFQTDTANLAVIILLPPSDEPLQEILEYASMVFPRLIFFTESSWLPPDWQSRLLPSISPRPIVLTVGNLVERDGYRFAQARLGRHHGQGTVPAVSEATMDELQRRSEDLTIAQLQGLLFGVYEDLRTSNPPVTEVTFTHFLEHNFRKIFGRGSTS